MLPDDIYNIPCQTKMMAYDSAIIITLRLAEVSSVSIYITNASCSMSWSIYCKILLNPTSVSG